MFTNPHLKAIEKLRRFSSQAEKLENHKDFFKNPKLEIKGESGKEVKTTLSAGSEETLIAVLVHFRNFYMKDSDFNFIKVAKEILEQQKLNSHWDLTRRFLAAWNKLLDSNYSSFAGLSMNINKNKLSIKRNLDLWMNEGYLHADKYKPGSLKGLDTIKGKHVIEQFSKLGLVSSLQDLCLLILSFNKQVVEKMLENQLRRS